MTTSFNVTMGPLVHVRWANGKAELRNLGDIQRLLERYAEFEEEALQRIGIVAVLFASIDLLRWGSDTSWTGLHRALDPYYLVLQDPSATAALERGLEKAIDRIREIRSSKREEDIGKELVDMLT